MTIKWSIKSKLTYIQIIDYLIQNWTHKEVDRFNKKVLKNIENLTVNPHIYPGIEGNINIRKAKISKQISLFYLIKKNSIELLFFWNEYKNPETLEKILSSH